MFEYMSDIAQRNIRYQNRLLWFIRGFELLPMSIPMLKLRFIFSFITVPVYQLRY